MKHRRKIPVLQRRAECPPFNLTERFVCCVEDPSRAGSRNRDEKPAPVLHFTASTAAAGCC